MFRKDRHAKTRLAYDHLQKLANTQETYSDEEMARVAGWSKHTVKTYRTKHWSDWVKRDGDAYRVDRAFERVTEGDFVELHSQSTEFYANYRRRIYRSSVIYEFLLPLTKERELKEALDALFYRDTIERRLKEIGLNSFPGEYSDINWIVDFVSTHFTGYSVSHVSGRFRARGMSTRAQAGEMFAQEKPYLVDETTAIVRFIVPIHNTESVYQDGSEFLDAVVCGDTKGTSTTDTLELARVRWAFFQFFAEAVVRTVKGEDQVWLLESGPENRLYVWEKS